MGCWCWVVFLSRSLFFCLFWLHFNSPVLTYLSLTTLSLSLSLFYRIKLTGQRSVPPDWTFSPGQWILERLEEVEDAPADDDVVVEAHKATHLETDREFSQTGLKQRKSSVKEVPLQISRLMGDITGCK